MSILYSKRLLSFYASIDLGKWVKANWCILYSQKSFGYMEYWGYVGS